MDWLDSDCYIKAASSYLFIYLQSKWDKPASTWPHAPINMSITNLHISKSRDTSSSQIGTQEAKPETEMESPYSQSTAGSRKVTVNKLQASKPSGWGGGSTRRTETSSLNWQPPSSTRSLPLFRPSNQFPTSLHGISDGHRLCGAAAEDSIDARASSYISSVQARFRLDDWVIHQMR